MAEEPDAVRLDKIRHRWQITDVRVLERGPLRAAMWVRLEGGNSRLDLTFHCSRGRDCVDVGARVFWNERSARLKLVMPGGDRCAFQVPGASVKRLPGVGQVPGGRWVHVIGGPRSTFGFVSDALYDFDATAGELRATICRASRYADDVNTPPDHEPWRPVVDAGELRFTFLIAPGDVNLYPLARQLEQPPAAVLVPPHAGELSRSGSLAELRPSNVQLLALKPAEDGKGMILRVQEITGRSVKPTLTLFRESVRLPTLPAHRIATWRLQKSARSWKVRATDATELV
jgi:alpha-mannosidase